MNLLAIDTASPTCSVAVCRDRDVLAEISDASRETHSRHLMTMIDQVLRMSVGSIEGIAALAVNRGPGSFTGVRIGISTAKGLAASTGLPLVGVSGLLALAWQVVPTRRVICPRLDARRREVYCARYRFDAGEIVPLTPETVCPPEDAVRGLDDAAVLIGDGVVAYQARLRAVRGGSFQMLPAFQHAIRAAAIAWTAWPRIERGENELAPLAPQYLRPSYAQEPLDKQGVNR